MSSDCIIEAKGAWAEFDGTVILREVNLCARYGEVLALIGASGSGKTTLLRLLLGLERPARGTVAVFGQELAPDTAEAPAWLRNRCGVMFQGGALFSALTVFDNVALPLRELKTLPEDLIRGLVMRKLALVEIDVASANKVPAELSGGMVKRVALARAIALDPELLFLDEPTSGLDPKRAHDFVALVDSLRRALGLTVLMASHDMETVVALADRIGVVADQRLVALAPIAEVIEHPHPFARSFFLGHEHPCGPAELHDFHARVARARAGGS